MFLCENNCACGHSLGVKKGDVSCPAFKLIYIYFSYTLSRFSFTLSRTETLMNSSFIFCDVIFAFVLVLPCT
jgi:hypothetical protein